jgi:bifunctional non-homologous end joining protein LigD
MQGTAQTPSVTLYYREGSSDKVYLAAVKPQGQGFVVTFAYGRRGSTLSTGAKTAGPVPYEQATATYQKLVKEKTAKGYTPGEDASPYQQTANADRATGVLPQLLNPLEESELNTFLAADRWWMQEKFDGKRMLLGKREHAITALNRNGLIIAVPESIVEAAQLLGARECLLDGEAVGDTFHAFDLLEREGNDLRPSPYSVRYAELLDLAEGVVSDCLRYAASAVGTYQKSVLLEKLRKQRKEGVVFKDFSAPYTPGRPASGGSQRKFKFTATASCIVNGSNGSKRSVTLSLLHGGARVGVGSVTIPPNQSIPSAGQVVEVRYLYAYPGGSLYQSVYLGVRDDIDREDCRLDQLKYRTDGEGEDEA